MIKQIFNLLSGRLIFQNIFENLYRVSLLGMNIGAGSDCDTSGEISVIKKIIENSPREKPQVVFDIGANIGKYTKILNKYFPKNTTIYSFEPSKYTFSKLKKNYNKISRINLYNFGFSNHKGKLDLFSDKKESGLASVYRRRLDHFDIEMSHKEVVEMRTIDEFCKESNIKKILFLKIDVEGHELEVLEGAKTMLESKNIKNIQFEFGGTNIDSRTFLQDFYYLLGKNYKIFRIVKDGIFDMGKYRESFECFLTTNYLAVLKNN
jgi:FkbM family methyltransferase